MDITYPSEREHSAELTTRFLGVHRIHDTLMRMGFLLSLQSMLSVAMAGVLIRDGCSAHKIQSIPFVLGIR